MSCGFYVSGQKYWCWEQCPLPVCFFTCQGRDIDAGIRKAGATEGTAFGWVTHQSDARWGTYWHPHHLAGSQRSVTVDASSCSKFELVLWSLTTKAANRPVELCSSVRWTSNFYEDCQAFFWPIPQRKNIQRCLLSLWPIPLSILPNKGQWLNKVMKLNTPHKPWQHRKQQYSKNSPCPFLVCLQSKNSPRPFLVCLPSFTDGNSLFFFFEDQWKLFYLDMRATM